MTTKNCKITARYYASLQGLGTRLELYKDQSSRGLRQTNLQQNYLISPLKLPGIGIPLQVAGHTPKSLFLGLASSNIGWFLWQILAQHL